MAEVIAAVVIAEGAEAVVAVEGVAVVAGAVEEATVQATEAAVDGSWVAAWLAIAAVSTWPIPAACA